MLSLSSLLSILFSTIIRWRYQDRFLSLSSQDYSTGSSTFLHLPQFDKFSLLGVLTHCLPYVQSSLTVVLAEDPRTGRGHLQTDVVNDLYPLSKPHLGHFPLLGNSIRSPLCSTVDLLVQNLCLGPISIFNTRVVLSLRLTSQRVLCQCLTLLYCKVVVRNFMSLENLSTYLVLSIPYTYRKYLAFRNIFIINEIFYFPVPLIIKRL